MGVNYYTIQVILLLQIASILSYTKWSSAVFETCSLHLTVMLHISPLVILSSISSPKL